MVKKYLAKARVFASSANIGPGFDRAGLALDIFDEFAVLKYSENNFLIKGRNKEKLQKSSLLIKGINKALEYRNIAQRKAVIVENISNIPSGGGLGSSASELVAGILLASKLYGLNLLKEEVFKIALGIEKHPDNLAATIAGGFVICFKRNGEFYYRKIKIEPEINIMLLIPEDKIFTKDARKVLPKSVPIEDAIENTSHFGLLVDSLKEGSFRDMGIFIKDFLHQDYRKKIYPKSLEIINKLINSYNIPAAISGSGGSVIALTGKDFPIGEVFSGYNLIQTKISKKGSYCI